MAADVERILIVAGEASADRYGADLVRRLTALHGEGRLSFFGTGGDAMQSAGVDLCCHVCRLGHIGPREALTGLKTYFETYRRLVHSARILLPRVAVLLDFPEFNLRLAKRLKRLGIPVVYYISPQIWAWRSGRIRTIRKYVDTMLVILPFEEAYYRDRGVEAKFVGHPLLEHFPEVCEGKGIPAAVALDPARRTVAILPGSRKKEIDHILPTLLKAALMLLERIPAQFVVSVAPTVDPEYVRDVVARTLGDNPARRVFHLVERDSREILACADFSFVKSGTSCLEAALVGNPFLIVYKISPLSWLAGSLLIRTPMKGLVNVLAQEMIVPELFQKEARPDVLARVALMILEDSGENAAMRRRLARIRSLLSSRCASEEAAAVVSGYLKDGICN